MQQGDIITGCRRVSIKQLPSDSAIRWQHSHWTVLPVRACLRRACLRRFAVQIRRKHVNGADVGSSRGVQHVNTTTVGRRGEATAVAAAAFTGVNTFEVPEALADGVKSAWKRRATRFDVDSDSGAELLCSARQGATSLAGCIQRRVRFWDLHDTSSCITLTCCRSPRTSASKGCVTTGETCTLKTRATAKRTRGRDSVPNLSIRRMFRRFWSVVLAHAALYTIVIGQFDCTVLTTRDASVSSLIYTRWRSNL